MSAQDIATLLREHPVFAAIPAREVDGLVGFVVEAAHRTRDYIFMEGDAPRWFCVVKSGRVKIVRHSRTGKDVILELLGPGEVFGGVAVIEKRPYPATAQATEPTVVLKIPADAIVALAERHPSIVKELALVIGRRLRAAQEWVEWLDVDGDGSRTRGGRPHL